MATLTQTTPTPAAGQPSRNLGAQFQAWHASGYSPARSRSALMSSCCWLPCWFTWASSAARPPWPWWWARSGCLARCGWSPRRKPDLIGQWLHERLQHAGQRAGDPYYGALDRRRSACLVDWAIISASFAGPARAHRRHLGHHRRQLQAVHGGPVPSRAALAHLGECRTAGRAHRPQHSRLWAVPARLKPIRRLVTVLWLVSPPLSGGCCAARSACRSSRPASGAACC